MNISILNLTKNPSTPEQLADGAFDPPDKLRDEIQRLLTFETLPSREEILKRADDLTTIALQCNASYAMIDCEVFFVISLGKALFWVGVRPCYSFVENNGVPGNPKHIGWVKL